MVPWDMPGYHLPLATFAAAALGRGELPLWDPYTYCGSPFYANMQTQMFYPPGWAAFLLAQIYGLKGMLRLLQWEMVLHVWLAGAGAFLLMRRVGAGLWGALAGAAIFQLSSFFASQVQHLGAICASAWLPLAWLSAWQMASEGVTLRRVAVLGAVMAMVLLAGFPAAAVVVGGTTILLIGLLALWRMGRGWALAAAVASNVWGVLLAAILLVPGMRLTALSLAATRGAMGDDRGGIPLVALRSLIEPGHNSIFDLDHFRLPYNPSFLYLYLGIAALALIPLGLWRAGPRLGSLLTVLIVSCGLAMFGGQTAIGHAVLQGLPGGLKGPLYPEYFMAAWTLAAATAAALGATRLLDGRHGGWGAALALVIAADLTYAGAGRVFNTAPLTGRSTSAEFEGSKEVADELRALLERRSPPDRFDVVKGSVNWATSSRMLRLPTAYGDDPMVLTRYLEVRRLFAKTNWWERRAEVNEPGSPVLDRAGVQYLIALAEDPPPGVRPIHLDALRMQGYDVYQRPVEAPRFYLARKLIPARSAGEAVELLRTTATDPRDAVVEGQRAEEVAGGTVQVLEYGANHLKLEVDASGPAFLATAEPYYPGWVAKVDAREVPIVMTNAAFRGLAVPEGRHLVEMTFRPVDLMWGVAVSAVAAIMLGWSLLRRPVGSAAD